MKNEKLVEQCDQPAQALHVNHLMSLRVATIKKLVETILVQVTDLEDTSPRDIKQGVDLKTAVRRLEIRLIKRALKLTSGYQHHAARLLGMKNTTLNSKIKRYGISIQGWREPRRS